MASSNFPQRNLSSLNSCKSKFLLTLIVFSIIDDFAHIPNSIDEGDGNTSFRNNHLTSLSCLNHNRGNEIETSSSHSKSLPSSCTLSSSSYSLYSTSFSQTKVLQRFHYTKQLSCDESKTTKTTNLSLFNESLLLNNSLKWRLDNDAINNKARGSYYYYCTRIEDKSQDETRRFVEKTSLMKPHLFSYILFALKKLTISTRWTIYPKNLVVKVNAIRLIRLDVPLSIQAGQPLRLRCLYDTKGEKLQSLSWYKNGREFYRYQPFERKQPVLAFKLNGVHVDLSKSRNSTVILTNTTSETSGRYKCEATGTTFQEVNMETYVNVISSLQSANSVIHPTVAMRHCLIPVLVTTIFFINRNYRFNFQIE